MQFVRLLHALQSIPKTVHYEQEWTNKSVPPDTLILHDFGDGPEPAIPVDTFAMSDSFISADTKNKAIVDTFTMSDSFIAIEQIN